MSNTVQLLRVNATKKSIFCRYIAVCYPLLHRDLVYTYSITKRVLVYTIPVLILSVLINIPKFMETKIVTKENFNVTTYTIDVTDLRYVVHMFCM